MLTCEYHFYGSLCVAYWHCPDGSTCVRTCTLAESLNVVDMMIDDEVL